MKVDGTVRRVQLYGAFVDIGLERDGLIHISRLSNQRVGNVSDVLKEGDTVTAWVANVDVSEGRVSLSLIEPPDVEWRDLQEGQLHTGKIVRMERYGVFVDIGAERPGLLHVREIGAGFVRHPSDMFQMGDEIEVAIREIDRRKKRIDLTMGDLLAYEDDEDEQEQVVATPMELAFQRAQEQRAASQHDRDTEEPSKRRREQDQLLARTLKQHAE
jgi:ribosomal protein S1